MKYLAIDIGGTFIKYALMDKTTDILEKGQIKTPLKKHHTILNLIDIIDNLSKQYATQLKGIAISMPGVLNNVTGESYTGGAIRYLVGNNLVKHLEVRTGLPVTVENDRKSAALAEYWKGSLKDCKNAAVVILGTGVGGGLIINGELYSGNQFAAGEFSYVAVNPNEINTFDGFWGQTGGARALVKLVSEAIKVDESKLDGLKIFEMANHGDEGVLNALDQYCKKLAIQIYNLQCLLDLDKIAIGGGISKQPLLFKYIEKNMADFCEHNPLNILAPISLKPNITVCAFHNESNLIGALYHHLKRGDHLM